MGFKAIARRLIETTGYTVRRIPNNADPMVEIATPEAPPQDPPAETAEQAAKPAIPVYDQDGLRSMHNHDFMDDGDFQRAYRRGCSAASDYQWHWRVHIGLWAAFTASKLDGDFVECGVNRGFLSSAIMEHLDWDSLGKTFYLLDTFEGLDLRYVSEKDLEHGALEKNKAAIESGFYVKGIDSVRENFSGWKNIKIIEGSIPDTLEQIDTRSIAYLHLDMNCSPPEVAAITFAWDRLVPGAIILLDDYAYRGYEPQKYAMDDFAQQKNVKIASLPTGQGLLLKPPT